MSKLEFKNHQVWYDFSDVLENLDSHALVQEHLEMCDYKVCGYWDEQDEYYEEILLPDTLVTKVVSSSIGVSNNKRFLKLKFLLLASTSNDNLQSIGELILVYDENLTFIDENWVLDMNSSKIQAKSEKNEEPEA